jgi:hypothetical protein
MELKAQKRKGCSADPVEWHDCRGCRGPRQCLAAGTASPVLLPELDGTGSVEARISSPNHTGTLDSSVQTFTSHTAGFSTLQSTEHYRQLNHLATHKSNIHFPESSSRRQAMRPCNRSNNATCTLLRFSLPGEGETPRSQGRECHPGDLR